MSFFSVYKEKQFYFFIIMIRFGKVTGKFGPKVWRVFIAGSSGAGKTFFAHTLLREKLFDFKQIFYYHPDIGKDS